MAQAEKVFKDLLCDGRYLANDAADPNDARIIDELRKQVAKLKTDLEVEKQKTRVQQSAHAGELNKLREDHDKRLDTALESALRKKDLEKQFELKKMEDTLLRQKDQELNTLARDKEEELKKLQRKMAKDAEDQLRQAVDAERKFAKEHIEALISGGPISERESNLTREVFILGEQAFQLESQAQTLRQENKALAEHLRRVKADHDVEIQDLLRQTKAEAQRDMAQLKLAERIISEKEQDLQAIEYHAHVAMQEREALVEELTVIKGLRSSLGNASSGEARGDESLRQLAVPKLPGSSGVLQKRLEELETLLRRAEDDKMEMKHENASLRKKLALDKVDDSAGGSKSVKQLEEKVKQLRKKNAELVTLAKSVDDKCKALKHENEQLQANLVSPADSEQQIKKSLSRQHAKDISEYTKQIHLKDKEIDKLKQKLAKHDVEGASKAAEGPYLLLEKNFKAMAMEKLRMERIMSRLYAHLPDMEQIENITRKDLEAGMLKEQVERLTEENDQLKRRIEAMSPRPPTVDYVDRPQDSPMSELQQSTSLSEGSQDNGPLLEALESRSEGTGSVGEGTGSRGGATGSRAGDLVIERGKPDELGSRAGSRTGSRMEIEIERLQAQIREYTSEKARMDARILELFNEKAALDARIGELSEYKNECVRLQGQLKELQEEGVAKDRKIRQLEELKVQAMEIGHELEATQEQCTKLELELAEMRRELNQREAKIRELEENKRTEREERAYELNMHQRRAELLEATIATKERYCESLRSTLDDLQKMADARERVTPLNDIATQTDVSTGALNPFAPAIVVQSLSAESLSLASSPGPPEAIPDGVVGVSSRVDVVARTRPMSASSVGVGGGGGGSTISISSLDGNLQLELKKAGFDASDPYETIDTLGQSSVSLTTSDLDRKLGVTNLNDMLESVEGSVGSVGSGQLPHSSPDKRESVEGSVGSGQLPASSPDKRESLGSGLGRRHPVGEEDEDLFHSVVERVEPVTMEMVGRVSQLEVTDCEDDNIADQGHDPAQPPPQTTALFIARFTYKPSESSPNANYDQELAITAGEYLYVEGEVDEDGFYMAKLMNGQTGMVPSNYVERVGTSEGRCDDVLMNETSPGTPPIRRKSVNLDEIPEGEEGEEEGEGKEHCSICSPHNIELLKQFVEGFGYTIAIKWELPLNLPQDATGYNVCVNGDVKMFVSNPLETTVMLSAIPRHTRVKIALQTVASSGLHSELSHPLILNPQYPEPPSSVQVSKAEGNAAILVSWPAVVLDTQVEGDSPVTGYALYLNGIKCAELLAGAQATRDKGIICQALLEPLDMPPSMFIVRPSSLVLTMRSQAQYESQDSSPVQLSRELVEILLRDGRDLMVSRELTGSHASNGVHHDNGFTQRYFKAMYDYNPVEQSLNNEGVEEELAFVEGDVIMAITDIDEDGFFEGELKGRRGLVPMNLVQEVDQSGKARVLLVSDSPSHSSVMVINGGDKTDHSHGNGDLETGPRQVVAIYDYNPLKDSLNSDGVAVELAFQAGDVITVSGKIQDGFIQGELGGRKGLVPTNFTEPFQQDCKVEGAWSTPASMALPPPTVNIASAQGEAVAKAEKKRSFLQLLRRKKET